MTPLVIEYVLEGKRPGYTLRSPSNRYDEALLRAVWRQAMPRGQGWSTVDYQGARALKCFPLDGSRFALSEVVVTDQRDESGRRGIRRAEITILPTQEVQGVLRARLGALTNSAQVAARRTLNFNTWARIVDRALPKIGSRASQIILVGRYIDPHRWQAVEAVVLSLALSWQLRALPGWGWPVSFTTLALTPQEESRIVAVPLDKAEPTQQGVFIEM